jgi:hypothetical protein
LFSYPIIRERQQGFLNFERMELEKKSFSLMTNTLTNWQGRKEWFFNREHTDTYEQWTKDAINEPKYGRKK